MLFIAITAGSIKAQTAAGTVQRVELEPGASEEITFKITPEMMELVNLERKSFRIGRL